MNQSNDDNIEIVSSALMPISKRESVVAIELRNNSGTTVPAIKIKNIALGGMQLIISETNEIHNLKQHQQAEITAKVTLPKQAAVVFASMLDNPEAPIELEFDVQQYMTKEAFESLPEWST